MSRSKEYRVSSSETYNTIAKNIMESIMTTANLDIKISENVNLTVRKYDRKFGIISLYNDNDRPYFLYTKPLIGDKFIYPMDINNNSFAGKQYSFMEDIISNIFSSLDKLYYYGDMGEIYDVNDNMATVQRSMLVTCNSNFEEANLRTISVYFDVNIDKKILILKPKGAYINKQMYDNVKRLKTFLRNNNIII